MHFASIAKIILECGMLSFLWLLSILTEKKEIEQNVRFIQIRLQCVHSQTVTSAGGNPIRLLFHPAAVFIPLGQGNQALVWIVWGSEGNPASIPYI